MPIDPDITAAVDQIEYVDHDPQVHRDALNQIIRALSSEERANPPEPTNPVRALTPLDAENIGTVVGELRQTAIRMGLATEPE